MAKYEKLFTKMLIEQPEMGISDEEAYMNSFENPEDAEAFETEPSIPGYQSKYIEKAKGWIQKIDEFSDWVNGTESDSLNKQFIDLDKEGSPFQGISNHSKKLTKIAEDLAGLSEVIKGMILAAGKEPEMETTSAPEQTYQLRRLL